MNSKTYRISIANHLGFLLSMWTAFVGVFVLLALSVFGSGNFSIEDALKYGLIIALPFITIQVALHLRCYLVNRGDVLTVFNRNSRQMIKFIHNGQATEFGVNDVNKVISYESFNYASKNVSFSNIDHYSHYVLVLENGYRITLTCLLIPDFNTAVFVAAEKILKKGVFRWPPKHECHNRTGQP